MNKIEIIDDIKLILFNPGTIFSVESVNDYISVLSDHNENISEYKRFLNLTSIELTRFKYSDFDNIASMFKKLKTFDSDYKACFYFKGLGIERLSALFFEKMKPEFDKYHASPDLNECAEYLEVDIKVLEDFLD